MNFDNTFLQVQDHYGSVVEISLRDVADQLNDLGYKIIPIEQYKQYKYFMSRQFSQLYQLSQEYGGFDTED